MSLTHQQQDLLESIQRVLQRDTEVQAAWLGGSLGRGCGDQFSDVDVVALVADGRAVGVGRRYGHDVAAIAEPALVNPLFGGRVMSVVTEDWRRFDVSFIEPGDLSRFDAADLVPLFNKGDLAPQQADLTAGYEVTPDVLLGLVNEFFRVLGLSVVAVGREEYILALAGVDLLRRLTVDMMLEENGVRPSERGGALRRNPLLTDDQRRELAALSPVRADRDGVIASNLELAAIFLPRARRLARRAGATWPLVLEAATRRHLSERLGMSLG